MLVRLDHKIYCKYSGILFLRPVNIQYSILEFVSAFVLTPILGDHSERDPPVPIPNTEVKPLSPDGTARASVWERRKLPGLSPSPTERSGFCVFGSSFGISQLTN